MLCSDVMFKCYACKFITIPMFLLLIHYLLPNQFVNNQDFAKNYYWL